MEINKEQFEKIKHCLPIQRGNVSIATIVFINALLYILSAEKKITFLHDLRLLPTENLEGILEDVIRREYI